MFVANFALIIVAHNNTQEMLRRFVSPRLLVSAGSSRCSATDIAREIFDSAEREQKDREATVDKRAVLFASGVSSDHRPRIAAAEAFDIAAASLPRPPNFCHVNVSLDYSAMMDAPEVVWAGLCRANGATPSSIKANTVSMLGGAVNHQRIGGSGFIQVTLGCIPDLAMDVFTFDAVPTASSIVDPSLPSPFACVSFIDAKLMLQHEAVLGHHISSLSQTLGALGCPLTGAVFPPVGNAGKRTPPPLAETATEDLGESIFFFNDRVFRGSAAGCLLRSNKVKAHCISVVPSIEVRSKVAVEGVTRSENVITIERIGGVPATDYIKDIYTNENIKETAKVFIGILHNKSLIPLTFFANPKSESAIHLLVPPAIEVTNGALVNFVVDDVELDSEAAAAELFLLQKKLTPTFVSKDIAVSREGRKHVVVSSCAGLHFSNRLMNVTAKRTDVVSLGLGNSDSVMTAPSVMQRSVGSEVSTGGVYTPGQLVTIGDVSFVCARSSTYTVLEGKE